MTATRVLIVVVELGGGGCRERGTGQKVTVVFGGRWIVRESGEGGQATDELKE